MTHKDRKALIGAIESTQFHKPLILQGGVDINPKLYGESPHPHTQHPNDVRDAREIAAVKQAWAEGRPVIGICRGAQLLCVLNGGKLYQHTPDHGCSHPITTKDGEVFKEVAAGHHQMMIPAGDFVVYGYDGRSSKCYDANNKEHIIKNAPEVVWWKETKSLAIQPHPEWMPHHFPFNMWLNRLIKELLNIDGVF